MFSVQTTPKKFDNATITYLYQEQQIMDLSASDIKLQKFAIRSQTV